MKTIFSVLIIGATIALYSCESGKEQLDSNADMQKETERSMNEANREIGMPAIVNFQEKKLMKQIYELRDQEDLICYAYYIDMQGAKHFLGRCVGYGLPYSTQFSNPQSYKNHEGFGDGGSDYGIFMPQPEPNGLFMPDGLSATWLLLIDPATNKPRPIYIESEILVSPFKLHE